MKTGEVEVVQNYVAHHNRGVRTGDFTQLTMLFAADAEMVFEFGNLGCLRGRAEIARAFEAHPPTEELVLGARLDFNAGIRFAYAWQSTPNVRAGTLSFTLFAGEIMRLVISP